MNRAMLGLYTIPYTGFCYATIILELGSYVYVHGYIQPKPVSIYPEYLELRQQIV